VNCFKIIEEINPKQDGWCSLNKATNLAAIVVAIRPKLSIEIGVYAGRSLIPLALAHKEVGGMVVGIDPWTTDAAIEGYDDANREFWSKQGNLERVKKETYFWLQRFDLHPMTEIIEKKSDDVEPMECQLLHVDGQHTDQAVRDVLRFTAPMKRGSFIIMDDVNWNNGGKFQVSDACNWIQKNGWNRVYDLDSGAVFYKP